MNWIINNRKQLLLLTTLAACMVAFVPALSFADVLAVGSEIPELKAVSLMDGKTVNLADQEKPVVVVFMQSACRACLDEIQHIQEWINDNPGTVSFNAVSVDMMATKEGLEAYAKKWKVRVNWYVDSEFEIPPRFGMNFTPGMVVLKDKKVVMIKKGWNKAAAKKFLAELESIVK